jgi:ubiquinone/menaquinone biosynthesis C-methylase UbiE
LRAQGELYPLPSASDDEDFFGSIDRFATIAVAFRNRRSILDVGSGGGILAALLSRLGHKVHAVDFFDRSETPLYQNNAIHFSICNIEADPLPFNAHSFDAVSCCQAFEHFTHSHLAPLMEMKRVLKPGGVMEIDVPNAVCFRNRSRILRGKHITWDYVEHYIRAKPISYKGREYYPLRHNREFTQLELAALFHEAGFTAINVSFLKDERLRLGVKRLQSVGSSLRNLIPSWRKSLIGLAIKPE